MVEKRRRHTFGVSPSKKPRTEHGKHTEDGGSEFPTILGTHEQIDFPRGDGTLLTPFEYKAACAEVFHENQSPKSSRPTSRSNTRTKVIGSHVRRKPQESERAEHLNYKKLAPGVKLLVRIVAIRASSLLVALPNQLMGHIPLSRISSIYTAYIESHENTHEMEDTTWHEERASDLTEMFIIGQFLQAAVIAVHASEHRSHQTRDPLERTCSRVELSVEPKELNSNMSHADIRIGSVLNGVISAVEDHGYSLDVGLEDFRAFLPFKELGDRRKSDRKMSIGAVLLLCVVNKTGEARSCIVSLDQTQLTRFTLQDIERVNSLAPGNLVQALVLANGPSGVILQLFGSFEGSIDNFQMSRSTEQSIKTGSKLRARIIFILPSASSPRFGLSVLPHVLSLDIQDSLVPSHAIGTMIEKVLVTQVEHEWGLLAELPGNTRGFVHISQTSDDHVPGLSAHSGPFKLGSEHIGRVTGYHAMDALLQLSLRSSVLKRSFLRVEDIEVGRIIKGKIKKLTDTALFVTISGDIDGIVWPNHFADIPLLRPGKRFKENGYITCRVLAVDISTNRVVLTARQSLVESTLPVLSSLAAVEVGTVAQGIICKVLAKGAIVEFYNHLKAFIPIKELSGGNVSETVVVGKPVRVTIVKVDSQSERLIATMRSQDLRGARQSLDNLRVGDNVVGLISEIQTDHVKLTLESSGAPALLSLKQLASYQKSTVSHLATSLLPNQRIEGLKVEVINKESCIAVVSLGNFQKNWNKTDQSITFEAAEVGQGVTGRIIGHANGGYIVRLSSLLTGILHHTDVSDDFNEAAEPLSVNSLVRGKVVAFDDTRKQVSVSTRRSRNEPGSSNPVIDPEIINIDQISIGMRLRGFVKNITSHGLFVTIGRSLDARVQIKELFDEYVKEWQSRFTVGMIVTGKILAYNPESKQIEMSLRSRDASYSAPAILYWNNLCEGQIIEGRIKRIETFGVFIEICGTVISGLCHKTEITDRNDMDLSLLLQAFKENDTVKAKILDIDINKRRISFGLKPSYFTTEESVDHALLPPGSSNGDEEPVEDYFDGGESGSDAGVLPESLPASPSRLKIDDPFAPLSFDFGFQWTMQNEASNEATADTAVTKVKAVRRLSKNVIEQDLTEDMHTRTPQSPQDFERLILGSPNSSFVWIRFMAFHLQLSDVGQARAIARRALQTIHFREEKEKLNIWLAMLNMENAYGSEDSLRLIFEEANRANDPKLIHLRMAAIYEQSEKLEAANTLFQKASKKFGGSSKVWYYYAAFLFKQDRVGEARGILPRSLQVLEKRKHVKTIIRFARLEYKMGEPERGRTIFEGVIETHPKRIDLWQVYIDMEVSQKDWLRVRTLFERLLSTKLTPHKAKAVFKKWLNIERANGNEDDIENVKRKAVIWNKKYDSGPN